MARSGCIYGSTGTFKTTAIAHFSHYIAEKTGKATLLFSADGGGWGPCEAEVEAGMIRPYRCDASTIPLPIVRSVSKGLWPQNPDEPDISRVIFSRMDFNEVGGIAVEGFTSIGQMLMRHVADKALNTGQEATSTFAQPINVDGVIVQEKFSGNSKAHYNFVQNQLYGMTMNFLSLPVEYVLFTGLESKGEDEDRRTTGGVDVPGKAITAKIPTWIGDMIHAQDFPVERKVRVPKPGISKPASQCKPEELVEDTVVDLVCRYYFKSHLDPVTGLLFKAKPRVAHGAVSALERHWPGGYFQPTPEQGFDDYLRVLDGLRDEQGRADDRLTRWRERMDAKLGRKPQPSPRPSSSGQPQQQQ